LIQTNEAPPDRRTLAILAAIIVLAALMRLPSLLGDGLWKDDANVYVEVIAPTFSEFLHRVSQMESHPPLYFCIAYMGTKLAGISELSLKLLPFLLSVLTVPLIYLLGKDTVCRRVGQFAAAIYAVAPLPIVYSSFYLYPLAVFSFTAVAWLVARERRRSPTLIGWAAIAFASCVAIGTHYMALLFLPLMGLWALASSRGYRHGIILASAIAVGMLPFVAWLPILIGQVHVGLPFNAPTSIRDKETFLAIGLLQLLPVRLAILDWTVFIAFLLGAVLLTGKNLVRSDASVLGAIFFAALIAVAVANFRQVRYVLPFYGLFCVFAATSLTSLATQLTQEHPLLTRRWGAMAAGVLAAVLLGGDVAFAIDNSAVPRSGIRTFAPNAPADGSTLFVLAPDNLAPTFAFYTRDLPVRFLGFARIHHPEIVAFDGYAATWSAPGAIDDALAAIGREAETGSFRYLDVIVQDGASDVGHMRFGRTWDFLGAVELHYRLLEHRRYAGKFEPISVYRFALR
jgi:4-amino-4-deoxy-L-arabinose transferase-like glycosyltransferase